MKTFENMNKNHIYKDDEEMRKIQDLDMPFTIDEILVAIKTLKTNKAPYPDQLRNELLNDLDFQIAPLLCQLFNDYLDSGTID